MCLSRKKQESIIVGEGPGAIEIKILKIGAEVVQLGVSGPRGVRVDRQEVRIRREQST